MENINKIYIHPTAEVSSNTKIGNDTKLWHNVQTLGEVEIGNNCSLGKGTFIGDGTKIGNTVKIGIYVNIFGCIIEVFAFIGPMVCMLEDKSPRSANPDGSRKTIEDWVKTPSIIKKGASVGASVTILPNLIIGEYAMISAGSVLYKSFPPHAFVIGNPARQIGYACHCGKRLDNDYLCSNCGNQYELSKEKLVKRK